MTSSLFLHLLLTLVHNIVSEHLSFDLKRLIDHEKEFVVNVDDQGRFLRDIMQANRFSISKLYILKRFISSFIIGSFDH